MSGKQIKQWFTLARESTLSNQDAGLVYKYVSIRQNHWQESLKMGEKKGFHQPENQFPVAGMRILFKNWISSSRKKSPNKKNAVSSRQKIGFHQQEWRIYLIIRFYETKKLLTLTEISEKLRTIVANSSDKSFKQASL